MLELRKKHILLVEDDALIALAERRVLLSAGYDVTVVHTGESALEMVPDTFIPDLILMDIDLGTGIDGPATAQAILQERDIPIVFLSSHTESAYTDLTEKITSYGFIQKGTADTILLASIRMSFRLWDAHRKVTESELRQTNLFEQVPGAIYQYQYYPDGTSRFPMASRNIALVYEVAPEDVVDDAGPVFRRIHPDDYDSVMASIIKSRDTLEDWDHDYRVLLPSRGERWLRGRAKPERMEDQSVLWHGYITDVTEDKTVQSRSAAQHEIVEAMGDAAIRGTTTNSHYLETELHDLVQRDPTIFTFLREGSLDGMWYWDLERPDQEWMDNRFWELLGYDPQTKRHDPTEWQDLIHPEDLKLALKNFHKHLEKPDHPYDQIVRYTNKSGGTVYVRCRGMAIRDENGRPLRMLGVHNDITVLMNTIDVEKRLRHELNHRVKNNLAIVHSLISLKHSEDNNTTDLSDILHQVETVRVLHEQLQASEELTTLELKPYLRKIFASIFDSTVEVDISGLEVDVTSKVAVPLGLVVNELATNAAKHGFSHHENKSFTVNILDLDDGSNRMRITVSNSGGPFPSHVNVDNPSSLGLRLVSALVAQLESSLTLTKQPHPTFEFDVEYEAVLVP